MKVYIAYRDETDYTRDVEDYLRDLERQTSKKLERIDPDTQDGAAFCALYDLVEYPTIIAVANDGVLQNVWRGLPLPLMDEVSYYAGNN